MKKHFIHILLLCSLFFNIAHASIIAMEDTCHESAHEYVLEQTQASDCNDLCELHHMFHFMAIITAPELDFNTASYKDKITLKVLQHTPPSQKTNIKPPIA